ncbi:MAG: hypothetical protein M0P91_04530 [Sulfuricurvum sp.]|jgi:metal-responsive CopG/Arc/MetJ family transcriptional regulator|uniref:hypothetical protein n=1 Tax=Sulfuricurvum sp. TaxID=2025608 RepID=UPI0025D0713A|nr:hypothetical protein [Sulfuricurvum sp.]MCK9372441.1 hypothetical protein [Sulfuricurvum sp.]
MKKYDEEITVTSISLEQSAVERLDKINKQFGLNNKSKVINIMLKNADEEFFVKCFLSQAKS